MYLTDVAPYPAFSGAASNRLPHEIVDEVKIWNNILNTTEINAHFHYSQQTTYWLDGDPINNSEVTETIEAISSEFVSSTGSSNTAGKRTAGSIK